MTKAKKTVTFVNQTFTQVHGDIIEHILSYLCNCNVDTLREILRLIQNYLNAKSRSGRSICEDESAFMD